MAKAIDRYLFRFDRPIRNRVFGDELVVSGWLFDNSGRELNGIRAVVSPQFGRDRTYAARRKRHRPDVGAAFPHLPHAQFSGFLINARLSLGRNKIAFEVRGHDKVWQTFLTTTVYALPLTLLSRLGFAQLREAILGNLSRRETLTGRRLPIGESSSHLRDGSERQIKRVNLLATTKSNLFILEIAQLIVEGFREAGLNATLQLDQAPLENPPDDTLQLVVTPHEYYNLFLSTRLSRDEARRLTRGVVLLGTEQPETGWFQSNLQWTDCAAAVADINPLGVLGYRALGINCHHLQLGYHPILAAKELKGANDRKIDITFLGSMTPRREKFFARHADFFSERRCHLRLVPLGFAKTRMTRSYLDSLERNELLSDTNIFLNLHYSEQGYFEWHRILVGLANGCCVISETCEGYGPLVPGRHFIMAAKEDLVACCDYYLRHAEERGSIANEGRKFIETHLRQSQSVAAFLRALKTTDLGIPADAHPVPLPRDLQRELRREHRHVFAAAAAGDWRRLITRQGKSVLTESTPSLSREEIIEKRAGFQSRLKEQEQLRDSGQQPWTLSHNRHYSQSLEPVISVVITLFNYGHFLADCVASIEEAAAQMPLPVELVIVNDASSDNSLAEAHRLSEASRLPVRIVDKKFNTGLANARNIGTELARAPYVFMMDADNLVFPDALRQLYEAIAGHDEVAAAYSLLCRFSGSPANRTGLLSYYPWDPQILVQHPYVDAMALFRRNCLLELGGYDSHLSQIGWFGWEDYDLWLRLAQRDLEVAFVPNTLCLYRQHETSMLSLTNLFELDLVEHFIERFSALSDRFEPYDTLFGVEREKINRTFRRRVLIASGCSVATTHLYRCSHLKEELEILGYTAEVVDWSDPGRVELRAATAYEMIFLYRLPLGPALEQVITNAKTAEVPVIFDTDDLVFEPELTKWHRAVEELSATDQELHRKDVYRYLETLLACNAATVATPILAELARKRNKAAFVLRNAVGLEMMSLANELSQKRNEGHKEKVIIGYGSGTPTHNVDFQEAASALSRILQHYPETELWIAGPLILPDELARLGPRVKRFPLTGWREWFQLLSQMDIALAPLEMKNIFCRAKSEIKFLEASLLGIAFVGSRIDPFEDAVDEGITGLLAADEKEWLLSLSELVESSERRTKIAGQAREYVLTNYTTEGRAGDLRDILANIRSKPYGKVVNS